MSEQLQTQLPVVDAEQAAHNAQTIELVQQTPSGTGWPEGPATASIPEMPVPATTAEAAQNVLPALNEDRGSVRLANRFANFMSNRRTSKQVAGEVAYRSSEYVGDKAEAAKAAAKKVGNAALSASVLGVNSALESATDVQTYGKNKVEEVRYNANQRKEARIQGRADRKETKQNAKNVKVFEKQRDSDYKQLFKESAADEKAMLKDAYSENKTFDKNVTKARRAESRAEIAEKAKKVTRVAVGAAALTGVVAGYAAYKGVEAGMKLDAKAAELGSRAARKTVEVIGDAGDTAVIKVRRGQQAASEAIVNARVTRLDSKYTKAEAKSKKYQDKIKKIVNN
jgi:hypothetical protein